MRDEESSVEVKRGDDRKQERRGEKIRGDTRISIRPQTTTLNGRRFKINSL